MSWAARRRDARRAPGRADSSADDVAREHHLGAEPRRLGHRAVREVGAGEALREAEVVLDRRALTGLTAGRLALDDDGAQALGGGVDRGGQPGRAGADDAQVVERLLGPGAQAERAGEVEGRRRPQHARGRAPARAGGRRAPASARSTQPPALVVAVDVEPR